MTTLVSGKLRSTAATSLPSNGQPRDDTVILLMALAVIGCHSLEIYAVTLLALLTFPVKMTASSAASPAALGADVQLDDQAERDGLGPQRADLGG